MPAYDGVRFSPPAPVATVVLRRPDDAQSVADVPMLNQILSLGSRRWIRSRVFHLVV